MVFCQSNRNQTIKIRECSETDALTCHHIYFNEQMYFDLYADY